MLMRRGGNPSCWKAPDHSTSMSILWLIHLLLLLLFLPRHRWPESMIMAGCAASAPPLHHYPTLPPSPSLLHPTSFSTTTTTTLPASPPPPPPNETPHTHTHTHTHTHNRPHHTHTSHSHSHLVLRSPPPLVNWLELLGVVNIGAAT